MKTYICVSPFQAYNTVLNKHSTIHTGACFVHMEDGKPNEQGLLLLYGITADDDKKMWIRQHVFQEYFQEMLTPDEIHQDAIQKIANKQTMWEALYA